MATSGTFNTNAEDWYGAYLKFSWSATQDVATNTSTVTWNVTLQGSQIDVFSRKVVVNGSTQAYGYPADNNYPQENHTIGWTVFSGRTVVNHDANGAGSFSVSLYGALGRSYPYYGDYVCKKENQTITLDTIPRAATITSAPNFTDQDNPVLQYSNPAGTAATVQAAISLDGSTANIAYRNVSNTGTSYTFNLTTSERNILRNATTGASRTVYFLLKTTIGSSTFTRSVSKTFTVKDVASNKPTVSNSATPDNSAIPSTYRSNFNGLYVQNFSKATVTVTASAKYSASITGYNTSLAGKNYSGASFTSDTIDSSGTLALNSTVTDSRGYTNSYSRNLTVHAYTNPTLTGVSVFRCNESGTASDSGTKIKITATRGYASVNGVNKAVLRYRYKLSTASWGGDDDGWIDLIARTATSTNTYSAVISGTFSATSAYNFQVSVVDDLGKKAIQNFDIPTEVVTLHMKEGGKALGFGTYAGNDESIAFAWKPKFTSGSISEFSSNPPYLLGIEAFASGGEMKWKAISDIIATKATQDANGLNIATGYIKRTTVVFGESSGSGNTQGWWKVASGSFTTYGNTNLAWLVKDNYARGTWGILVLEMRGSTGGAVSSWGLRWLFRSNFSVGDFIVVASGTSWTLYGYRNGNYGKTSMIQLQQKNINGADLEQNSAGGVTYYNNTFYGTTAPSGEAAVDYGIVNQANKLGSATVGAAYQPIYLNAGTPTAATTLVSSSSYVSRTSGWAIASQTLKTWGRSVTLTLTFNMASSGTAYTGNRLFNGTLTSFKPAHIVTGAGFLTANSGGSHSFGGYINTNGEIVIAAQDDITYAGGYAYISFSYLY